MSRELEKLRHPSEHVILPPFRNVPDYIKNRCDLIRSNSDWWAELPRFQLGWDVLEIAHELEYRIVILTQGPRSNPNAWSGKKRWIDNNLGEDVDVNMTRDKSLVYGKVLVDDYPRYIDGWLKWRKRGLVIMPAHASNSGYTHPNVIRYDGSNLDQVYEAMEAARNRRLNEPLDIG